MSDLVGKQFGNYRLIRFLGEGSFSEVYVGEHVRLNTLAAIKVLHTRLTKFETGDFLTEALDSTLIPLSPLCSRLPEPYSMHMIKS